MAKPDADPVALAAAAIRRIPGFGAASIDDISPLSENGNGVFRVVTTKTTLVVRLPGRRRYISTGSEYRNQKAASVLQLAPRVLGHDPESGAIVCEWAAGFRAAQPGDFKIRARLDGLATTMARLHLDTPAFPDHIPLARALDWNLLGPAGSDSRFTRLARLAFDRIAALPPQPLVNCHGDLTRSNLLVRDADPGALLLIDWEYSHRTTAAWDLSIVCADLGLESSGRAGFLQLYNEEATRRGGNPVSDHALNLTGAVTALIAAAWMANEGANFEPYVEIARRALEDHDV